MALRYPITPLHLKSPSSSSSSSSSGGCKTTQKTNKSQIRMKAELPLKQQWQRRGTKIAPDLSPLLPTEETAARFGLEMSVLELERLFRGAAAGGDRLFRQISGPFHPSLPSGSSGRPVRVAYQGVRGSYCQEAAVKAFSSLSNCDAFPCHHMEAAFDALNDESADRAVIPVENSLDGPIDRNLDLLLRHAGIRIVGELVLPVNHCLLALPGVSRSDLRRIVSHPQALSHCNSNLSAAAADLDIDEVPNSADAARYLSENRISDTAVIGSKIAAKEFGLEVLEQNFQDPAGNFNRFLQLGLDPGTSRSQPEGEEEWKTTVAFSLENGVSDLFRALWHFETRDIPVIRVEHRPNRSNPIRVVEKEQGGFGRYMDYVFIVDLERSVSDSELQSALTQLKEISGFVRVLGSYKCRLLH